MEGGTRLPGDIGPADDFIYVALWPNMLKYEGLKQVNGGSLARRTLANFAKRAGKDGGKPAKAKGTKGELFYGAPKIGNQQMGLGFWHRPTRLAVGAFGPGRESMAPVPLVLAVDKAKYKPILGNPWNDIVKPQAERP